jgi:hypothetical protein
MQLAVTPGLSPSGNLASNASLGGFVIPAEAGIHIWPELARRLDTGPSAEGPV